MSEDERSTASAVESEIEIRIDRHAFRVPARPMSGAVLRQLPTPPLGADQDLFQTVSGAGADLLIDEGQVVDFENGTTFFSAPQKISAG